MYHDKVEMRFAMDQVHTSLVLFFAIVVTDPAPFRRSNGLAHLGSLMSYLPPLLVNLAQCALSYLKLKEDTFHPVKLVKIMFHISYGVRRLASVLCHHTEVDERSDASECMFERYHLLTLWLTQCHCENSQNTAPQIPHLLPLPLRNLAVGFFGYQKPRVRR